MQGRRQRFQRRDTCCHRQRIPRERTRLINRTGRSDTLHDLSAPTVNCDRQTATNYFAERRKIGSDPETLLCPAR